MITRTLRLAIAGITVLILAACGQRSTALPPLFVTATPRPDAWLDLSARTAYPYAAPLPPPVSSALDGVYAKVIMAATPVHCVRCPEYAPYGGLWRLSFDKGVFRVFYGQTEWRSLGSFTVSGDQLQLFNDPNCPETVGVYRWRTDSNRLMLEEVADDCAIHLRAKNLAGQAWLACPVPPSAAETGGPGEGQDLCP